MNLDLIVFSGHNLSKTKDTAYIINLDEYESIITHWLDYI